MGTLDLAARAVPADNWKSKEREEEEEEYKKTEQLKIYIYAVLRSHLWTICFVHMFLIFVIDHLILIDFRCYIDVISNSFNLDIVCDVCI